jgi:hypothetical protein
VSFCLVDCRPFVLSLLLLLQLFSMRCDAMQCYDLLFTFVFCRDLWFCFWPSSQPPQGFMVFFSELFYVICFRTFSLDTSIRFSRLSFGERIGDAVKSRFSGGFCG